MNQVKIIECPRDAMQGIKTFIPTAAKVQYINALLKVGFDTIDYGPREILKYDYPETIYSTSMKDLFDAVSTCAEELRREVTTPFEEIFHLVFDGKKIALHFFIQKDYIQC